MAKPTKAWFERRVNELERTNAGLTVDLDSAMIRLETRHREVINYRRLTDHLSEEVERYRREALETRALLKTVFEEQFETAAHCQWIVEQWGLEVVRRQYLENEKAQAAAAADEWDREVEESHRRMQERRDEQDRLDREFTRE